MKKQVKWMVGAVVALAIVSTVLNVMVVFQIQAGDRVVVKKSELDQYRTLIDRYSEVEALSAFVEKNYYLEVDEATLTEGMMKGLFEALDDPYSVFMDASEFEQHSAALSGEFPGIGIYYQPNEKGQVEIVSPIEGTPADRAGLQPKDVILSVDGIAYTSETIDDMVDAIKGEVGTTVELKIFRPKSKEEIDMTVERAWISTEVAYSKVLEDSIGYVRLTLFDEDSASALKKHLDAFEKQGLKKVVFDLRQNHGGYLDEALKIADMFLDEAVIVSTKGRNGEDEVHMAKNGKYDFELVVLIDEGSASASEIVTGALKDNDAATIVGDTSFGKGLVQTIYTYNGGRGYKLTTSQYFTPDGSYIHKKGIDPDVPVTLDEDPETDEQLDKAVELLTRP